MSIVLDHISKPDAAALHKLVGVWERHWKVPLVTTYEELVEEIFEDPNLDLETDVRVVRDGSAIIGYGVSWKLAQGNGLAPVYMSGAVHPDRRRQGVGTALIEWQIDRGVEMLEDADPDLDRFLRCDEYAWIEDAHQLHHAHGFAEVRRFQEMVVSLDDQPKATTTTDGVFVVPWDGVSADELLEMRNAAFADHWGSTPRSREDWDRLVSASAVRLDLSFLAVAGGRVVGQLMSCHHPGDEASLGTRDGWIETLAVSRRWRGRGIASALIQQALDAYRAEGFSHAKLGVDTASHTGAERLYQRLGFVTYAETITNAKPIG